jgi:hypothetical protein
VLKRWQSRYFVVAGHYLKYAGDEQAVIATPKAAVDLEALHACSVTRDTFLELDFVDGMVLVLQAETSEAAEEWLQVLTQFTPHKDDKQAASMMRLGDNDHCWAIDGAHETLWPRQRFGRK